MNVNDMSIEDLEKEIKKRKYAEQQRLIPSPIANPDLTALKETCQNHLQRMLNNTEEDDDEHYIYEDVMRALYGNDVFSRVSQYKRSH